MMRCVEESLRRLGTDHIDLYLLHFWDGTTPIDEIMRGLDDLVSAGKILYLAVSDVPAWRIAQANTHRRAARLVGVHRHAGWSTA